LTVVRPDSMVLSYAKRTKCTQSVHPGGDRRWTRESSATRSASSPPA
jgi:hypothetical protein